MNQELAVRKAEIRMEKQRLDNETRIALLSSLSDLLKNPVIEFAGGLALIAYLNKGEGSWLEKISGLDLVAGTQSYALVALIMAQQLAPYAPAMLQYGSEALTGIIKAVPAIAAAGGG